MTVSQAFQSVFHSSIVGAPKALTGESRVEGRKKGAFSRR